MDKTVTEHLREYALNRRGFCLAHDDPAWETLGTFDYEARKKTEWSGAFEQCMRNRFIVGSLRYGNMGDPSKSQWDRLGRIVREVEVYLETGDTEALVEIATHAMLEFVEGVHPLKHFASRDGGIHTKVKKF